MKKIRSDLKLIRTEYLFGLHSGIPRCCVIAWCKAQLRLERESNYITHHKGCSYRPCIKCKGEIDLGIRKPVPIWLCYTTHPTLGMVPHDCKLRVLGRQQFCEMDSLEIEKLFKEN